MAAPRPESSAPSAPDGVSLHSARIRCEVCGAETPHRILHIEHGRLGPRATVVRGVARCRVCGTSHPFASALPQTGEARLIVSDGARSERQRVTLPSDRKVQVGSGLPESTEPLVVRRIEDRAGRPISVGRIRDIATIWAVRATGPFVLYSLIEGRFTRAGRLPVAPETVLEVGSTVRLPTTSATIVGLRARNHTWRREGDRFPAAEVQRVYARRTERPPAGRRDWSTERETPSSRARSTSTAARSRSSPGTRRMRTVPRARTADSGAAVHRSSFS